MHLLIPFAGSSDEGCQAVMRSLKLVNLQRVLSLFPFLYRDDGEATSFSPPHERAHARALTGIDKPPRLDDGRFPWATWYTLQKNQSEDRSGAWAFITPCHWDINSNHISMADPSTLALDEADSRALMAAMQPYFAGDGIRLCYDHAGRWLASGDVFRGLPTASLDRVVGQPLDIWMPETAQAKPLRRLQNEMQMLLYTHPVNDQRQARGLPVVNSFWISGTGRESAMLGAPLHAFSQSRFDPEAETQFIPAAPEDHWHDVMPETFSALQGLESLTVHIPQSLRDAALRQDWPAWGEAWKQIDATYCVDLLKSARVAGPPTPTRPLPQLTLCGERNAFTFQSIQYTALRRLSVRISRRLLRKPTYSVLIQL